MYEVPRASVARVHEVMREAGVDARLVRVYFEKIHWAKNQDSVNPMILALFWPHSNPLSLASTLIILPPGILKFQH